MSCTGGRKIPFVVNSELVEKTERLIPKASFADVSSLLTGLRARSLGDDTEVAGCASSNRLNEKKLMEQSDLMRNVPYSL